MADPVDTFMLRLSKDKIKFLRFEMPSVPGKCIGMLVPARHCERYLRNGFPFAAFTTMQTINTGMALEEIEGSGYRNTKAFPDLDTYRVLPWALVPTASVMMSQDPKWDAVYPTDPRQVALRQLARLSGQFNLDILASIEHEFILLDSDNKPISKPGCYEMERISKFADFLAKVDDNLLSMGINCERMHSEVASGQYEITAVPSYNIKAADDAHWIRAGVREMASLYRNWTASFVTHLPLADMAAGKDDWTAESFSLVEDDCGAHFNHSLWLRGDTNKTSGSGRINAFWDSEKGDLSDIAMYWIGGILNHIGALTAFACPTSNCYTTRLLSPWVSSEANWGRYNRTAVLRVKPNKNGQNTHFEYRLPSSLANPYLVLASIVCAGLDGIKNKTLPPKEVPLHLTDPQLREECYQNKVPSSLEEALVALEADRVLFEGLGGFFVGLYVKTKRLEIKEIDDCRKQGNKPLFYSLL